MVSPKVLPAPRAVWGPETLPWGQGSTVLPPLIFAGPRGAPAAVRAQKLWGRGARRRRDLVRAWPAHVSCGQASNGHCFGQCTPTRPRFFGSRTPTQRTPPGGLGGVREGRQAGGRGGKVEHGLPGRTPQ